MKGFTIGIIGAGQAATELLQQLVAAEFVHIVAIADLKTDTLVLRPTAFYGFSGS